MIRVIAWPASIGALMVAVVAGSSVSVALGIGAVALACIAEALHRMEQ